ncbi:MAG: enoyl-CoA hydratase/isomerase family protein [Polyangiaceae bacterium]
MRWIITNVDQVVVVHMTSNKVNKQNEEFFADLHDAFDRVEAVAEPAAIVLRGQGRVFSAGLDFHHVFPLFGRGDPAEVGSWFGRFSQALLRVFNYRYPTVAAINGHAIAGGLILALCCDHRVAAAGPFTYGLNEVPIGIPMPSLFAELLRFRLGSAVATRVALTGELYTGKRALELGFFEELVDQHNLMSRACAAAIRTPVSAMDAYAHSKRMLQAPVTRYIDYESRALDAETFRVVSSDRSKCARALAVKRLKPQS